MYTEKDEDKDVNWFRYQVFIEDGDSDEYEDFKREYYIQQREDEEFPWIRYSEIADIKSSQIDNIIM